MSLGLGIHGEPGFKDIEFPEGDQVGFMVAQVLEAFAEKKFYHDNFSGKPFQVVTVSNLGGFCKIEFQGIVEAVLEKVVTREEQKVFFVSGDLMTSLDMRGFNVSLAFLDQEQFEAFSSANIPMARLIEVKSQSQILGESPSVSKVESDT